MTSPHLCLPRLLISAFVATLATACLHDGTAADSPETSSQRSELVGNAWGPLVEIRDDSNTYPTNKPVGGWWVAPIHATLLTSGKVLITGWGRRDRDHCGEHGSRLTGTTFLLDPNALPPAGTLNVQPIAEAQTLGTSDVLYCSGHTPIADGRVLFTGGARYEHLGDHSELEFGLEYARLFSPQSTSFARVTTPMLGGLPGLEGKAWYPTNTRLPDGRVLVIGGFARCMTHRNLRNTTTNPWKQGDSQLDWYGPESAQTGISHDIRAPGTALDWTTNNSSNGSKVAVDGFGYEPLNDVGDHLSMLDVEMDCARGFKVGSDSFFEVKSFIAGPGAPGWEPDVTQAGTPYATRNHVGKCGMVNIFARGSNEARVLALP